MDRRNLITGLLSLIALFPGCGSTSKTDTICDPQGCISLSKFSANISSAMENQVVGYVSIVGGVP